MTDRPARPGATVLRRFAIGSLSNYTGKLLSLATWFFLTPFILRRLGPSDYGLWIVVGSVAAYGALLDLGIAGAIVKYLPELRIREEFEQAGRLVATALWLYLGLGMLVIGASLVAAPVLPRVFGIAVSDQTRVEWLVRLMGASVGLSLPAAAVSAVLQGLHRYDIANVVITGGTLISAAATVAVLSLGGDLLWMVAANLPVAIGTPLAGLVLARRAAPDLRPGWRSGRWSLIRPILSFSSSVFVVRAADYLQTKTDEIVIAAFLPLSAVTPYSIARRLSELTSTATEQFLKVLPPLASEIHAQDEPARFLELYVTSTRLALAIAVSVGCTLILMSGPILTLWVGAEFASSSPLVLVLTLAAIVDVAAWPGAAMLQSMARHRPLAFMAIATGSANLVLSAVLIQRIGVLGVALGTLIPSAAQAALLVVPYTLRTLRLHPLRWLRSTVLSALGPAVPQLLVVEALTRALRVDSAAVLLGIAVIGGLVYAVGYLMFAASELERDASRLLLAKLRPRPVSGNVPR